MPEIQIPSFIITGLQVILAFGGAFFIALWFSLIIWTLRDVRSRSRDIFAILLATLMVVIFGPLGLILYFLLRPSVTLAELYERSLEEEALLQDLEERPRCPGCSRQVDEAWIVCPDCHTNLKKMCPSCHKGLHLRWNICPFCGALVPAASAVPDHYDTPSGHVIAETRPMAVQPPVPVEPSPTLYRGDETRPHRPETEPI